jgi:hypothetical protein
MWVSKASFKALIMAQDRFSLHIYRSLTAVKDVPVLSIPSILDICLNQQSELHRRQILNSLQPLRLMKSQFIVLQLSRDRVTIDAVRTGNRIYKTPEQLVTTPNK